MSWLFVSGVLWGVGLGVQNADAGRDPAWCVIPPNTTSQYWPATFSVQVELQVYLNSKLEAVLFCGHDWHCVAKC